MHLESRVLVTGGAGFIGSHRCQRLIDDGAGFICLDNFSIDYFEDLLRDDRIKAALDRQAASP